MSSESAASPQLPVALHASADAAVRGFATGQANLTALEAIQDWLQLDGWSILTAHEKQTAIDLGGLAARFFSDVELLADRIPVGTQPTDQERLSWARDQLARAQAEDESSCGILCVVPLTASDASVAHLGCLITLQGQAGPKCEWLGLWATAESLYAAIEAGGRYWLSPHRGKPTDSGIMALWNSQIARQPALRTLGAPAEAGSEQAGQSTATGVAQPMPEAVSGVLTLFVNLEYDNEATLGMTMAGDIDEFGEITWRELITEVQGERLPEEADLAEWLEENYGIEPSDLEKMIDSKTAEAYYTQLAYRADNSTGAESQAHDLIRELGIITLDEWGDGSSHGVHLYRTTANGPRKYLVIDDQAAADWLTEQCRLRGVHLEVRFV